MINVASSILTNITIYTFKHTNDTFVELNSFFKTLF
jgi:hypothetical protein